VRFGARWSTKHKNVKHAGTSLLTRILRRIAHDREKLFSFTDDFNSRRLHHLEHCSETSVVLRTARLVSANESKGSFMTRVGRNGNGFLAN